MNNDKGVAESVSFDRDNLELYQQAKQIAKAKHGDNFSLFIREAVRCYLHVLKHYGDWRQLQEPPGWANELLSPKD